MPMLYLTHPKVSGLDSIGVELRHPCRACCLSRENRLAGRRV
jgi:hypothetical protein